jgi:hypothetical protein
MATTVRRKSKTAPDPKTGRITETHALTTQFTSQAMANVIATPASQLPPAPASDPGPQSGLAKVAILDFPGFEGLLPFSGNYGTAEACWRAFAAKNGIVASEREAVIVVGP